MKRIFLLVAALVLAAFLPGCAALPPAGNTVTPVELKGREELIARAASDKMFVFDYHVDDSYAGLTAWVEVYRFGKKADKPSAVLETPDLPIGNGTIIFSTSRQTDLPDHQPMLGIMLASREESGQDQAYSSITQDDCIDDYPHDAKKSFKAWDMNGGGTIPPSGKMVLGALLFTNGSALSGLSREFYENYEEHLDTIEEVDAVYVLGCTFTKKP
jgi:hypothetical protein